MIGIGIAVAWAGYSLGIWGYCLIRGYDVPFTGIFKATWPGGSAPSSKPSSGAQKNPVTGTVQAPGSTTAGGRG